eukprot:TRINITY_DN13751_c0_g1_i1.p1 TRINITY_DN13751_c0_g1~~TRINITY_DN13751_c0_g1_i1.p1  ORF type:complete len:800 (+),score=132.11 TRINITY_DN13751_c0_g1_i1:61-2460(+)
MLSLAQESARASVSTMSSDGCAVKDDDFEDANKKRLVNGEKATFVRATQREVASEQIAAEGGRCPGACVFDGLGRSISSPVPTPRAAVQGGFPGTRPAVDRGRTPPQNRENCTSTRMADLQRQAALVHQELADQMAEAGLYVQEEGCLRQGPSPESVCGGSTSIPPSTGVLTPRGRCIECVDGPLSHFGKSNSEPTLEDVFNNDLQDSISAALRHSSDLEGSLFAASRAFAQDRRSSNTLREELANSEHSAARLRDELCSAQAAAFTGSESLGNLRAEVDLLRSELKSSNSTSACQEASPTGSTAGGQTAPVASRREGLMREFATLASRDAQVHDLIYDSIDTSAESDAWSNNKSASTEEPPEKELLQLRRDVVWLERIVRRLMSQAADNYLGDNDPLSVSQQAGTISSTPRGRTCVSSSRGWPNTPTSSVSYAGGFQDTVVSTPRTARLENRTEQLQHPTPSVAVCSRAQVAGTTGATGFSPPISPESQVESSTSGPTTVRVMSFEPPAASASASTPSSTGCATSPTVSVPNGASALSQLLKSAPGTTSTARMTRPTAFVSPVLVSSPSTPSAATSCTTSAGGANDIPILKSTSGMSMTARTGRLSVGSSIFASQAGTFDGTSTSSTALTSRSVHGYMGSVAFPSSTSQLASSAGHPQRVVADAKTTLRSFTPPPVGTGTAVIRPTAIRSQTPPPAVGGVGARQCGSIWHTTVAASPSCVGTLPAPRLTPSVMAPSRRADSPLRTATPPPSLTPSRSATQIIRCATPPRREEVFLSGGSGTVSNRVWGGGAQLPFVVR